MFVKFGTFAKFSKKITVTKFSNSYLYITYNCIQYKEYFSRSQRCSIYHVLPFLLFLQKLTRFHMRGHTQGFPTLGSL